MARLSAWAADGRTVIASLHDLTLAARYASRILALKSRVIVLVDGAVINDSDLLTEEIIHRAFGVRAQAFGTRDFAGIHTFVPKRKMTPV